YGNGGITALRNAPVRLWVSGSYAGPSGSVYVGLQNASASNGMAVVRVTAGGQIDTSFSGDGFYADAAANGLTVDSSGRVVLYRTTASGSMSFGSGAPLPRSALRLTTTGVPDTTYHAGD